MNKIFIIEHLEPELYEWCIIEYRHISKIVGKNNIWFTNIRKSDIGRLIKFGKVFQESVKNMNLKNACILDPDPHIILTPKKAMNFHYFIFGGILGDYPPRKRTKQELSKFMPAVSKFNIGKVQMSTDNAVYTVKKIIEGKNLNELKFQDKAEIKINSILTTVLPFRYNLINKKPLLSPELIKFIKNRDNN